MKRPHWILLGIIVSSLLLRLSLMVLVHNPGLHDQNHYYNLGRRLNSDAGFSIDYVWQFSHIPEKIVHPIDHWLPLSGIVVMLGMKLGGENIHAALLLFILAGTILPLLVYLAARQYDLDSTSSLIAVAFATVLPDIVWNSLRTDTTILNMVLITASLISFNHSLKHKSFLAIVSSGFLGGLAYLNRNDSILILPTVWGALLAYAIFAKQSLSRQYLLGVAILIPISFMLTISPWLIRNQKELGMLGSAETSRMFFMVDQRDHYAYDTEITLETMLAQQTITEIASKRLFELLAAFKQIILSLDIILPVLIPLGLLFLLWKRDIPTLLTISPALIWMIGILIAYPILIPYKSQSGSFEKAYLTIVPMLIPIAVIALKYATSSKNWQIAIAFVASLLMIGNSYDLIRNETRIADNYYATISQLVEILDSLPDVNEDSEIRVMTQDPYVMSYFGYQSVMIPFASREQTLELAQKFKIDYLIMPAARPALDALYHQSEIDPRFVFTAELNVAGGNNFELYALHGDAYAEQ